MLEEEREDLVQANWLLELRHMVTKEKQKLEMIWWEKCKQILTHEDQLEEKYVKISEVTDCSTAATFKT